MAKTPKLVKWDQSLIDDLTRLSKAENRPFNNYCENALKEHVRLAKRREEYQRLKEARVNRSHTQSD